MAQIPKRVERALCRGWSVIPCRADKRPAIASWKEFQENRPTADQVADWAKKLPPAWAVITGALSGVVILDFDGEPGLDTMKALGLTPHVKTPGGGHHCYAVHPGFHVPTLNSKSKRELGAKYPGLDIRADGGYALFTGRTTKGEYQWLRAPHVDQVDLAKLPEDLRRLLNLIPPAAPAAAPAPAPPAPERAEMIWLVNQALARAARGEGRNNSGFWLAVQMRDNGYSESEALDAIRVYARQVGDTNTKGQREPYTGAEAFASVRKAYQAAPRAPIERGDGRPSAATDPPPPAPDPEPEPALPAAEPPAPTEPDTDEIPEGGFHRTDLGNAERLRFRHGKSIRFSKAMDRWFIWDGRRFRPDERLEIHGRAAETVRSIYREAAKESDSDRRNKIVQHAVKSESRGAISAMVDLARHMAPIAITPEQLDTDPWLFNCQNGTLDLRTRKIREHRREDLITKLAPVPYFPNTKCPRWLEFLHTIMDGNENLIRFLQRAVGYCLTGDTSERVLFFPYGQGRNGKSTFLETIHRLTGDYGMKTPRETLMHSGKEAGIPNDIARLAGARYVYASETKEGGRLNEEQVKNLTGEQTLTARFLYAEIFEFRRQFKLWLASNHKPIIRGADHGIWDRMKLIPFTVRIPEDKVIARTELDTRFTRELPGILTWAVEGCRDYLEHGLGTPAEVEQATSSYQAEMDVLSQFLEECCEQRQHHEIRASLLYRAYVQWVRSRGEFEMTQTAFGTRLSERGFERTHRASGWFYLGICISAAALHNSTVTGVDESDGLYSKTTANTYATEKFQKNQSVSSVPSLDTNNQQVTSDITKEEAVYL
jgi:putative DNA primase/helicase